MEISSHFGACTPNLDQSRARRIKRSIVSRPLLDVTELRFLQHLLPLYGNTTYMLNLRIRQAHVQNSSRTFAPTTVILLQFFADPTDGSNLCLATLRFEPTREVEIGPSDRPLIRYRVRTAAGKFKHKSETLYDVSRRKAARADLEQRIREASVIKLEANELTLQDFAENGTSLEAGTEGTLFLALARLIGALPVAQRLQLLDIVRNSLEPVQTEAAPTKA